MIPMPVDSRLESTAALRASPYTYISEQCRQLGAPVFEARLLLRRTICMSGAEAAALFYDGNRFQRKGGAPEAVRATLFGKAAVQTLDGPQHRCRKALFMELLTEDRVNALANQVRISWQEVIARLPENDRMPLYETAQQVYTQAVCEWAAVPLNKTQLPQTARLLVSLFDDAARNTASHFRSRFARHRTERWAKKMILQVRSGQLAPPPGTALHSVAMHKAEDGRLLDARIAAKELLNILRPTVATSVYLMCAAHALHIHPGLRSDLARDSTNAMENFLMEVRRFYPFFPAVAAVVREDFEWQGFLFKKGRRALLDLYGTNHDPSRWTEPHRFRPDRHAGTQDPAFSFIPQGGGDAASGHRCPGEGVVTEVMKASLNVLLSEFDIEASSSHPGVDFSRLPALPEASYSISRRSPS